MKSKPTPIAFAIAGAVAIGILFIAWKITGSSKNSYGTEGTAVIVKPSNPNDPKFTQNLPKGIAGGNSAGQGSTSD